MSVIANNTTRFELGRTLISPEAQEALRGKASAVCRRNSASAAITFTGWNEFVRSSDPRIGQGCRSATSEERL